MQVRLGLPQAAKSAVAAAPLAAAIEPVRAPDFFALIGEEAHPIRKTNGHSPGHRLALTFNKVTHRLRDVEVVTPQRCLQAQRDSSRSNQLAWTRDESHRGHTVACR